MDLIFSKLLQIGKLNYLEVVYPENRQTGHFNLCIPGVCIPDDMLQISSFVPKFGLRQVLKSQTSCSYLKKFAKRSSNAASKHFLRAFQWHMKLNLKIELWKLNL